MKISKSKKELARIISENGGWREHCEWVVQDKSGEFGENSVILFEGQDKPIIEAGMSEWMCAEGYESDSSFGKHVCNADKLVKNWHQTVLSREEYFHLYPAPDADGWIEWKGGIKSPVDSGVLVDVRLKCGAHYEAELLDDACWSSSWDDASIISYRLHKPGQEKPELCDYVMRSIPEPETKPTIEQLAADYRNAKDYADRKQQEADAAKANADAKLKALELAGEALGLLVSPITTKKEPELVITDWRDLLVGDVIKCVGDSWGGRFRDSEAVVEGLERHDYEYDLRICASIGDRTDWGEHFTFIRRP